MGSDPQTTGWLTVQLDRAAREVASWPQWKQDAMRAAAKEITYGR